MPYIQRDEDGNVVGLYANFQEGYAEEELPDDDQAVIEFKNKTELKTGQ